MILKYNDKPVVIFSCLSVCEGHNGILRDNGTAVTFNAYMAADKNKMVYTFNAFDEIRERVIKMKMKKNSRIMIVAVLKNYITTDNVIQQSYTVGFIDYCPADDNHNHSAAQSLTQIPTSNTSKVSTPYPDINKYQRKRQQPNLTPVTPVKQTYSYDMKEVNLEEINLEEFAMAIGGT